MDSFEFNKLIGAVLAAVFVVFSIGIVSDSLFAAHTPEQAGFAIEAAEPEAAGGGEGGVEAGPEPIAPLMASADPAAGETLFKRCAACHTPESGGANKIGPNLWGIVNRPVASHEGFSYSAAMKAFAEGGTVWDYQHLSDFTHAPKALVKGTAMNFPGLKKPEDRANLLAYLRTLADSPAPLPEPTAAEAPAGGEQPAAEGEQPAAEGEQPAQGEQPAAGEPATTQQAPAQGGQQTVPAGEAVPNEGKQQPAPGESPAENGQAPAAEQPAEAPAGDAAPAAEEPKPAQ